MSQAHDHHGHDHHGHDHGHGHAHHQHGPLPEERGFALGVSLNLGFVVLEVAAGLLASSMALLAESGHNLSDGLPLVLAWVPVRLARRLPSRRRTYGFHRASIL